MDTSLLTIAISAFVSVVCAVASSTISFKIHTHIADRAADKARLYTSINFLITVLDNDSSALKGVLAKQPDAEFLPMPIFDLPIKITMSDITTNFKFYPMISRHFIHHLLLRNCLIKTVNNMQQSIERKKLESFSQTTEDMLQLLLEASSVQELEKKLRYKGIYTWTLSETYPKNDD